MKKIFFASSCLLLVLAGAAGLKDLHHYVVMGLNPFLGPALVIIALLILLPLVLWAVRRIKRRFRKATILPSTWLAAGAVIWFALGVLSHFFGQDDAFDLDLHFHDTYIILSRSMVLGAIAVYFGIAAWAYHTFSLLTRRKVNNVLAYIHFWLTFLGMLCIFLPAHYEAPLSSMPRRYMDYSHGQSFNTGNLFLSAIALITIGAQLLLPASLFYALVSGRKNPSEARRRLL